LRSRFRAAVCACVRAASGNGVRRSRCGRRAWAGRRAHVSDLHPRVDAQLAAHFLECRQRDAERSRRVLLGERKQGLDRGKVKLERCSALFRARARTLARLAPGEDAHDGRHRWCRWKGGKGGPRGLCPGAARKCLKSALHPANFKLMKDCRKKTEAPVKTENRRCYATLRLLFWGQHGC
jgi:hypothetical protein